jgi:hypothetical protein
VRRFYPNIITCPLDMGEEEEKEKNVNRLNLVLLF